MAYYSILSPYFFIPEFCTEVNVYPNLMASFFLKAMPSQLIIYPTASKEIEEYFNFSSSIYDNFADFDAHKKTSVLGLRFKITKEHYQVLKHLFIIKCVHSFSCHSVLIIAYLLFYLRRRMVL